MSEETRTADYGESWLEVAAAVEYLDAAHRPGFTVWDALAEALRWWINGTTSDYNEGRNLRCLPWSDPDPLRTELESLLRSVGPAGAIEGQELADVLDCALRQWVEAMAAAFNDHQTFVRRQ